MTKKKTVSKTKVEISPTIEKAVVPKKVKKAIPKIEEEAVDKQSVQSKNQSNQSGA